jgi:hypothetical protein
MTAPDGNDILPGGNSNDVLRGGAGADSLYGEDGDDVIEEAPPRTASHAAPGKTPFTSARWWSIRATRPTASTTSSTTLPSADC